MAQWPQQRDCKTVLPCENSNDSYGQNVFYEEMDDSSDSDSQGDGKSQKSKKRVPKCARCKNHGISAKVKDHKDMCPMRYCFCHRCNATSVRQREMKKQTALRRQLARFKKVSCFFFFISFILLDDWVDDEYF